MAINLAEDSVHALNRAAAVAAREECVATGPHHILVGVLSQREPALLDALDRVGLDPTDLPAELCDAPETFGGHLPFTPAAHQLLAAAIESAAAGEAATTDTLHLLLAVARCDDPECREILEGWGLSADAFATALAVGAREKAAEARASATADGSPETGDAGACNGTAPDAHP